MKTSHHTEATNTEIANDLAQHGMTQVHVDVDDKKIAYVSGEVKNNKADAAAIAVVLQHDVAQVQDGLERPDIATVDLARAGAIGPLTHQHPSTGDAAQRILGASHLEGRIFDASSSASDLETGTPLATLTNR